MQTIEGKVWNFGKDIDTHRISRAILWKMLIQPLSRV
jgi:hypothetical protein